MMDKYTQDERQAIFDTLVFDFESDIKVDTAAALAVDLGVNFVPAYYVPDFLTEHVDFVTAVRED